MKAYVITLAVGLLVGALYGLLNVRSPAPPIIALIGLLGILIGEQIPPLAKRMLAKRMLGGQAVTILALREHCGEHVFGRLPTGRACSGNTELNTAPKAKTAA
jgi:XapX domain-containing protein